MGNKQQIDLSVRRFQLGMQLRQAGRISPDVLSTLLDKVPREAFVPQQFYAESYHNVALPVGQGQTISAPEIVAQMTSALDVSPGSKVLEVGTGSGYQAAVLSRLVRQVYTIERWEALAERARRVFDEIGFDNIVQFVGDGSVGLVQHAPFDRIILTAAPPQIPRALVTQLNEGGVLVAPVGKRADDQHLLKCTRMGVGTDFALDVEVLGKVRFVPLVARMPQV